MEHPYRFDRDQFFVGDLLIHVTGPQWSPAPPRHSHNFHELVLVAAGTGVHVTENGRHEIGPGSVFVVADNELHHYEDTGDLAIFNVLFDEAELQPHLPDLERIPAYHALFALEPSLRDRRVSEARFRTPVGQLNELRKLLERMRSILKAQGPAYVTCIRGMFATFISHVLEACTKDTRRENQALLRVADTIVYMEDNHANELTLEHLASHANMSRSSFLRAFKDATNNSPIQYLLQYRLERAAALLRTGNRNVTDTAFAVGFHDSNYFSRQFKRLMGMNPKAYQASHVTDSGQSSSV